MDTTLNAAQVAEVLNGCGTYEALVIGFNVPGMPGWSVGDVYQAGDWPDSLFPGQIMLSARRPDGQRWTAELVEAERFA